MKFGVKELY